MFSTTTTVTKIISPYQGRRISSTSTNMLEVITTITYTVDGFSISVEGVPSRLDQEREKYYLAGPIALRLNRKVNEIIADVQRKQEAEPELLTRDTPLMFELKASDFLSDAA